MNVGELVYITHFPTPKYKYALVAPITEIGIVLDFIQGKYKVFTNNKIIQNPARVIKVNT